MVRALVLALLVVLSPGCATIVRGTTQDVKIECTEPGARITVDGKAVEPGVVELKRGDDHEVVATAEGCQPARVAIKSSVSTGWAVAETIFGLAGFIAYGLGELVTFVPLLVDSLDGAICTLDTEHVVLRPVPVEALPPLPSFVAEPDEVAKFCSKCGEGFAVKARFCAACGAPRTGRPAEPPRR